MTSPEQTMFQLNLRWYLLVSSKPEIWTKGGGGVIKLVEVYALDHILWKDKKTTSFGIYP